MIQALKGGDLNAAMLPVNERRLLDFVTILTERPASVSEGDVQSLRDHGWTEQQISESVYITALFAFFNRVADAFGLDDPNYDAIQGRSMVASTIATAHFPPPESSTHES